MVYLCKLENFLWLLKISWVSLQTWGFRKMETGKSKTHIIYFLMQIWPNILTKNIYHLFSKLKVLQIVLHIKCQVFWEWLYYLLPKDFRLDIHQSTNDTPNYRLRFSGGKPRRVNHKKHNNHPHSTQTRVALEDFLG